MTTSDETAPGRARDDAPGPTVVTSYAEARRVLLSHDYRPVGLVDHLRLVQRESGKDLSRLIDLCERAVVFQWGEEHLRLRRLLTGFFGRRGMAVWKPMVEERTDRCLRRLKVGERFDLLEDFADPLFAAVVPAMLGVKVPSTERLLDRVSLARHFVEPLLSPGTMLSVQDAFDEILSWVRESVEAGTESEPRPFVRELVEEGADVRDPSVVGLVASLLVAAHTTSETLGFILWRILRAPPEDRRALRDPARMGDHLESLLRLYPSTLNIGRQVLEGAGAGCPHHERDQVWIHVPSVNRDPAVFPDVSEDGPLGDRVEGTQHLSFGAGPHKCPGAAFARLVIGVAIPALLRRFPDVRLVEAEVRWLRSAMIRMPDRLPCEVGP